MSLQTVRPPVRAPREPACHELDPIRISGQVVNLQLTVRRTDDGVWRGRLRFIEPESQVERETAEILCGASEEELWGSLRDLRDHHLRDLYRSLV